MKKQITPGQRRRQDYLRRQGLKVGAVYEHRLEALRRKEVKRVLGICRDYDDAAQWHAVIENNLSESAYFEKWLSGLYVEAGTPNARSVARDLTRGKAADPSGVWEDMLRTYARENAGRKIVTVSGTLKTALREILAEEIAEEINAGVYDLSKRVYSRFTELLPWQCLRIARTETMIGLAESARAAAQSLDIRYVKEWCISGLMNTRDSHEVMDGVTVDENEYFELEDCLLLYPHDQSTNPPAGEIINCACSCIRIPK